MNGLLNVDGHLNKDIGGGGGGGEHERSRQKKGRRQAQFVVGGIDHLLIVFEWTSGDW